jgi:hypothetical protein
LYSANAVNQSLKAYSPPKPTVHPERVSLAVVTWVGFAVTYHV